MKKREPDSRTVLILASASPARKRLLREAGIRCRVVPSGVRETLRGGLREVVLTNARRKAAFVSRRHPEHWVLAADTLIEFRGRIYGKPRNREAALRLHQRLSGETHRLATGVVLQRGSRKLERVVFSRVTLKSVEREDLVRLFQKSDPTRFAGGYAVRRRGDPLVRKIRGSFSNVVGLPLEILLPLLRRLPLIRR